MAPRPLRRNGYWRALVMVAVAGCSASPGSVGPTAASAGVTGSAVGAAPSSAAPAPALLSAMVPALERVPVATMSDPVEPVGAARVVDNGSAEHAPLPTGAIATLGLAVANPSRGAISPDGARILVHVDGELPALVDTRTGRSLRAVGKAGDEDRTMYDSAISPDGKVVALQMATEPVSMRIVDAATGATKHTLDIGRYAADNPTFAPDSSALAFLTDAYDAPQELVVIDVGTGSETRQVVATGDAPTWKHVALGPGGRLAALTRTSDAPAIEIRDVKAARAVRTWKPSEAVDPIVFSSSGEIVAGTGGSSVFAWRVATGELAFERRLGVTSFLQAGPDDTLWVHTYLDALIALDSSGATQRRYRAEMLSSEAIAFTDDGEVVSYSGYGRETRAWVRATGQPVAYTASAVSHAEQVRFSNNGKRVFGVARGDLEVWDVASGALTAVARGSEAAVTLAHESSGTIDWTAFEASVRAQGLRIVETRTVGGRPRAILRTAEKLVVVEPPSTAPILEIKEAFAVAHLLADGSGLLVGGYSEPYSIRDLPSGSTRVALESGEPLALVDAIPSPDGARVFGRGEGATVVTIYSGTTGAPIGGLHGDSSAYIGDFAVSPDGKWLLAGCADNDVRLWNVATGSRVAIVRGHSDAVTGVAFSNDGARFATASRDGTILVWDTSQHAR